MKKVNELTQADWERIAIAISSDIVNRARINQETLKEILLSSNKLAQRFLLELIDPIEDNWDDYMNNVLKETEDWPDKIVDISMSDDFYECKSCHYKDSVDKFVIEEEDKIMYCPECGSKRVVEAREIEEDQ